MSPARRGMQLLDEALHVDIAHLREPQDTSCDPDDAGSALDFAA
jgi:hypothetical protein